MSSDQGGSPTAAPPTENMALLRSLLFGGQITPAIAVFNPTTGTLSILHGSPSSLDPALLQPKAGPLPATKDSIAALPIRDPTEEEIVAGRDCAICLEEFTTGVEVTEMPCNHCFHRGCVQRWLGINGSCPVCRYAMPVDDHAAGEDKSSSEEEIVDSSSEMRPRDEQQHHMMMTTSPPVTLLFTLVIDRLTGSEPESSAPRVVDGTGAPEGSSGDVAS